MHCHCTTALTATITANQQQQQPPPSPIPADVEPSSSPAPSSPTPTFSKVTQVAGRRPRQRRRSLRYLWSWRSAAAQAQRRYRPKSRIINWIQCDTCYQWLHNVCAGIGRTTPAVFVCLSYGIASSYNFCQFDNKFKIQQLCYNTTRIIDLVTARCICISAVYAGHAVSVRPSVCRVRELRQNE